jgi:glycolate oxidase iron-sulfur subunit
MCLPYCPTYTATQLESESPRGRIAIIQGLISHKISNTPKALAHLDNCLTCRACEKICPSDVNYGELLDQFKSHTKGKLSTPQKQLLKSFIRFVLLNVKLKSIILFCIKLVKLENLIGIPTAQKKLTPTIFYPNKTLYQTTHPELQVNQNIVGLFVGCTGSSFDRQTLNDVIFVLNTIGFNVKIANASKCCGALDSHAGHEQEATLFAEQNIKLFNELNVDHIVYFASGCGAQLSEYHKINWGSSNKQENANTFTNKLSEVCNFIHEFLPDKIQFKETSQIIAIHEPCTHRNVLKQSEIGFQLLSRINNIKLLRLEENKFCCGAAGDYMMTHKAMANKLRSAKLKELSSLKPDLLLTTNIGCAMHLRKGLFSDKQSIAVKHPVSLIAELLKA